MASPMHPRFERGLPKTPIPRELTCKNSGIGGRQVYKNLANRWWARV
jgi:hypothetical protein